MVENSNATAMASRSLGVTNIWSLLEKGEYLEAGSLQIAAAIARQGGDRIKANAVIEKLGGKPRSVEEFEAIKSIGASRLGAIMDRIDKLQEELMDKLPLGLFKIGDDEYLLSWLVSGTRWNEGQRLPRKMTRISQQNSQPMLSEESAHIIRHILFEYKIPLSKFGGLLNMFAVLLLGRELDESEYSSASTIRTWMDRLAVIDKHYQRKIDRDAFLKKSKYGFDVLWGATADDTQLGHKASGKTHLCLRVTEGGGRLDDDFAFDGIFECLANSKAVTEDNKGNADLNFESFQRQIDDEVITHFGGFMSDNMALSEGHETMERVLDFCENHDDETIQNRVESNGVRRRAIVASDMFHNCNLTTSIASSMMCGETDKTNLREFHPKRVLQQFHDFRIREKAISDHIAEQILEEWRIAEDEKPDRKTARQRKQRWKVDGEFAERIIKGLQIRDPNDEDNTFWDEWCKRLSSYFEKSNMRHEILEQIGLLLSNPGNVVCLTFEAEMVTRYWYYTHKFHSFTSENCPDKPGLDIMGVLNFFIDFIVPFWQGALDDPGSVFPDTVAAINELEDDDERTMKMEQLEAAIEAANDKLAKLYERWLSAPLCFLLLSNPVHGPPLLRVILRIVEDFDFDLEDREDRYMEGLQYERKQGIVQDETMKFRLLPSDVTTMPDDKLAWFEMLNEGADNVFHFF